MKPTLSQFALKIFKKQSIKILILAVCLLAWGVQESFFPWFIKQIVNSMEHASLEGGSLRLVWHWMISLLIFQIGIELFYRIYDYLSVGTFASLAQSTREELTNYSVGHSHEYFSKNMPGALANKINQAATAFTELLTLWITIFLPVLMAFLIQLVLLYQTKPIFTGLMALWFTGHMSILLVFSRKGMKYSEQHSHQLAQWVGQVVDVFNNISNIRLFAQTRNEQIRLKKYLNCEKEAYQKLGYFNAHLKTALSLWSFLFSMTSLSVAIYAWSHHMIKLGDVILVASLQNLVGLAWYMGMHIMVFFEHWGRLRDTYQTIKQPYSIKDTPNPVPFKITRGEIKFESVDFRYPNRPLLFQNFNLTIRPGEKVGLVGTSGSGKTTLGQLILRYYDIEKGRILIDRQDIAQVAQESLRQQIVFIAQDTTLFQRSILENIRYAKPDATDEEVIEAAKRAHAHEFIQRLPEGYQTLLGDRGVNLSGGQRQRVSIARAFLKKSKILVFDEATSALDSEIEYLISESLYELMQDRTTIVIAHRLSTLRQMDRLVVFENGKIIEQGSHEGLMEKEGKYAQLWSMQSNGCLYCEEHEDLEAEEVLY